MESSSMMLQSNMTMLKDQLISMSQSAPIFVASETVVSNALLYMIKLVVDTYINTIIVYMGVVINIIMVTVFYKQGLQDSFTITMTAIGLWDLVKCMAGAGLNLYGVVGIFDPILGKNWFTYGDPCLYYLHIAAGYVSGVMAAYVAVERCICVSFPFKVKEMFTPRVTSVAMVLISIIVFGSFTPVFFVYKYRNAFSPLYNANMAYKVPSEFHSPSVMLYYTLIGIIYPIVTFIVIVVCTVIISMELRKSSAFKSNSTAATTTTSEDKSGEASTNSGSKLGKKERQVMKLLLVVIIVYIVNFLPRILRYFAYLAEPGFYKQGKYHNLFDAVSYFIHVFDFMNASMNFFIFLAMSSSFRATFIEQLCCKWCKPNKGL